MPNLYKSAPNAERIARGVCVDAAKRTKNHSLCVPTLVVYMYLALINYLLDCTGDSCRSGNRMEDLSKNGFPVELRTVRRRRRHQRMEAGSG